MTPRLHRFLPLLLLPLLAACINDGASYEIDGTREHTLSVVREQPYLWDKKVNLSLIVSRMPTCMRRHAMGAGTANTAIEVWRVPSGAFILKVGQRYYATETQTCEGFAKMDGAPDDPGMQMGVFKEKNGRFDFESAGPAPAAAAEK